MDNVIILTVLSKSITLVLLMVVINDKGKRPLLRLAIYAPLLVPQVSLVLGLQAVLVWFWLDGTWLAMLWIHALFICPFAYLIIAPAAAAIDRRYIAVAASLGAGPGSRYLRVALPLLAPLQAPCSPRWPVAALAPWPPPPRVELLSPRASGRGPYTRERYT